MPNAKNEKPRPSPLPMRGPGHMMGAVERARDFKATMKSLIGYLRPFWFSLVVVLVFAVLSTVFTILSPKILGNMTNQVVSDYTDMKIYDQATSMLPPGTVLPPGTTGADLLRNAPPAVLDQLPADKQAQISTLDFSHRPVINFGKLGQIAITLIMIYLLGALFGYIQGWIMSGVSQKITYRFRRDISKKINRLPLKYFDTRSHGDVLSRVINDVDTVSQTLNQSLTQIVTSVTLLLGILVMMFTINWLLTLVAIIILPLSLVSVGTIIKRSQKHFKRQQDSLGLINGHIEEMYSGHNVMKVFNGEERSLRKFRKYNDEMYDSAWKAQFLSGLMWPIINFVGNLGFVGISVLGGVLALRGAVNIGDIQAFIQYVRQFNQPVIQTANIANILQSTAAAAERVFEFLKEKEEIPETKSPLALESVRGRVEFDHVVFGYDPEKIVIRGFDLAVNPGQRIAIVGPTGAGKTTLVNLLMRFYELNSGTIRVDGVDILKLKRAALRRLFGMVLQDTWLFNGTIGANIAYGRPDATDTEIAAAAEAAHADRFIRTLPGGYAMEINEEADNISQGEKQLITIARAMLADPPILILDEATSSVDTRTEVLIQKAMDKLMAGRTSFVIAHRLSTIRHADLILVMNDGRLIEQGTHSALLARNGFYASLYQSQFLIPAYVNGN